MNNNRFWDNKGVSHPIVNGIQPAISLRSSLGSTSLAVDMNAARTGDRRYRPYGENRFTFQSLPTTFDFTGQRIETSLGLHFFQARWFDSYLNRWISPDTIVPLAEQGIQAWNRYAYVNNNPVRFSDPTGHVICDEEGYCHDQKKGEYRASVRYGPVQNSKSSLEDALSGNGQDDTPNLPGMIAGGVALTVAIAVVETFLLVPADLAMIPVVGTLPLVGVPMEAILISATITLIDIDIAYWSYVYRIYETGTKQNFEWLPPWGLWSDD
jgi:RHS repeat-associated protein